MPNLKGFYCVASSSQASSPTPTPSPRKKKGKENAESNEKGPWSFCSAQAQGKLDSLVLSVLSAAADMQHTTPGRGPRAGAYSEGCQAAPTLAPAAGRKEKTSLF